MCSSDLFPSHDTINEQFFITNGFRPNVLADMYAVHGFIAKLNDDTLVTIEDGDLKSNKDLVGVKFTLPENFAQKTL